MKICKKCEKEKEILLFGNDKYSKDGKTSSCLECRQIASRKYHSERKEEMAAKSRKYYHDNKEERLKYRKKYYNDNKEQESERWKHYYSENREKMLSRSKEYQSENRDVINKRERERRREDVIYRLRKNTSRQIRKMIEGKSSSIINVLPYSFSELKEHIEQQFDNNMSWDNYGDAWHIDHIYPQSKLPYDSLEHPNFQKCWALENLRPLDAIDNMRKGNKIL